jgi:hypothetical protein
MASPGSDSTTDPPQHDRSHTDCGHRIAQGLLPATMTPLHQDDCTTSA